MLIIDNREEIKQYLLKETGSLELSERILSILEDQDRLSKIYTFYKKNDVFMDNHPHNFEDISEQFDFSLHSYSFIILNGESLEKLIEQAAAIITVGDFAYKLFKQNQGTINNFIQTNVSRDNIEAKIEELLKKVIMRFKIKETREEDEKTTDTDNNAKIEI